MSTNDSANFSGRKALVLALGAVVVAVLAIVIFCHVAVWLMWIGFFTVVVLGVWIALLVRRGVKEIEDE